MVEAGEGRIRSGIYREINGKAGVEVVVLRPGLVVGEVEVWVVDEVWVVGGVILHPVILSNSPHRL